MKKPNFSILFLGVMILFSWQMNQKSVGISNWSDDGKVYKWHLGSESAVDVAANLDKAMKEKDYTLLRNFLSDTVRITSSNGTEYNADSFIDRRIEIDSILESRNATLNWEYSNIFSVLYQNEAFWLNYFFLLGLQDLAQKLEFYRFLNY